MRALRRAVKTGIVQVNRTLTESPLAQGTVLRTNWFGLASSALVERRPTFSQRGLLVRRNRSRASDSLLEIICFLAVQHININRETLCFVRTGLYDSVSAEKHVCDFQISSIPAIQWLKWRGTQGDAVPPPQIYGRMRSPTSGIPTDARGR